MNLEEMSTREQWLISGYSALYLARVDRLVVACAGLTLAILAYPAFALKTALSGMVPGVHGELLGLGVVLIFSFVAFGLVYKLLGFWLINPVCGMWILAKIRHEYGPMTRQKVLEWVLQQGGADPVKRLDIAAVARAQGEF